MIDSTIDLEEFNEIVRILETDNDDWCHIRDQLVVEIKRCWRRIEHLENANKRLQDALRNQHR